MKIFVPLMLALAPAGEAKKNGNKPKPAYNFYKAPKGTDAHGYEIVKKHPLRVLQSTSKTFCKLVTKELDNKRQALRYCDRWTGTINKYAESFGRLQCAFYDPLVPKGGPHPDPMSDGNKLNSKGQWVPRRLRRDVDDAEDEYLDDYGDYYYDPEDEENLDDCTGNETGIWKDICEGNFEDDAGDGDVAARRKKKKGPKLSKPQRRARKITVTLAAWCERHIYNCYGQRTYDYCSKKAAATLKNLMPLLPAHVPKNPKN